MRAFAPLLFGVVLVLASGCGEEGTGEGVPGVPSDTTDVAGEVTDYEAVLVGAMTDTLRGPATFGDVVDARSGQTVAIVRLASGFDFGGGFFLTYGAEQLPGAGRYTVDAFPADSVRDNGLPAGFSARYRKGLLINLRATGGSVQLDQVTDTLVTGSFDITLFGLLALPGGAPRDGSVRAVGAFTAHDTGAGYIIGF